MFVLLKWSFKELKTIKHWWKAVKHQTNRDFLPIKDHRSLYHNTLIFIIQNHLINIVFLGIILRNGTAMIIYHITLNVSYNLKNHCKKIVTFFFSRETYFTQRATAYIIKDGLIRTNRNYRKSRSKGQDLTFQIKTI